MFSSHVSQEPHGVGPPAQLTLVPARLVTLESSLPDAVSKSMDVVPPPLEGSYTSPAATPRGALPARTSWLRTRRVRPDPIANAAMPSCAAGVSTPSDCGSPVQPNVR